MVLLISISMILDDIQRFRSTAVDAAGRLASPKRYGALTGSPPETAATARVPAFVHGTGTYACALNHGTGTYACAVPRMRDIRRVGPGAEPLAVQQLR